MNIKHIFIGLFLLLYSKAWSAPECIVDTTEIYDPVENYTNNFNKGTAYFNARNWAAAFRIFEKAADIADTLIKAGVFKKGHDSSAVQLAGNAAQNAGYEDDAVEYYKQIAKQKLAGEKRIFLYKFLCKYYLDKNDIENFNFYTSLGKELFPKNLFFKQIEFDFVRQQNDLNKLLQFYDVKIATDTLNYSLYYDKALAIFQYLYPADSSKIPLGNLDDLFARMSIALFTATRINKEFYQAFQLTGTIHKAEANRIAANINQQKNTEPGLRTDEATLQQWKNKYISHLSQALNGWIEAEKILAPAFNKTIQTTIIYRNIVSNILEMIKIQKKITAANHVKRLDSLNKMDKRYQAIFRTIH